jgi:hypothetical protein
MPILLDTEPRDSVLRAHDHCDWLVVPTSPGRVTLTTGNALLGSTCAVAFTPAALPQLRRIVELLEPFS